MSTQLLVHKFSTIHFNNPYLSYINLLKFDYLNILKISRVDHWSTYSLSLLCFILFVSFGFDVIISSISNKSMYYLALKSIFLWNLCSMLHIVYTLYFYMFSIVIPFFSFSFLIHHILKLSLHTLPRYPTTLPSTT